MGKKGKKMFFMFFSAEFKAETNNTKMLVSDFKVFDLYVKKYVFFHKKNPICMHFSVHACVHYFTFIAFRV